MDVLPAIQNSLNSMFTSVGSFLPTLIGALIILVIGWIIAKILRTVLEKVLRTVKFDTLADRVGINGYLAKGGMKTKASGIMAKMGYWMVMFTVLNMFFNKLGVTSVSNLMNDIVKFIPNILVGCLLLIVGMYGAQLVSGIVKTALKGSNFKQADLVGNIAYGAIMFLAVTLALNQLGIGGGILDSIVSAVFSSLGLGLAGFFAIAFGLGGRDWAQGILNKYAK